MCVITSKLILIFENEYSYEIYFLRVHSLEWVILFDIPFDKKTLFLAFFLVVIHQEGYV